MLSPLLCVIYNPGHNILELCSVLVQGDSPQVKRNLISSITKLVYYLLLEFPNDLRLRRYYYYLYLYYLYYYLYIYYYLSPRHYRRWGGLGAHTRKKKGLEDIRNIIDIRRC